MPFWKKAFQKTSGVYYPQAVVQGKPVETETIAKDLAKISTVSNSDVQAVLGDIAGVMHARIAMGKSVHITGLGYFRYTLDTVGVKKLEDFDFKKQVKAVRVEFIPEREKITSGTYSLDCRRNPGRDDGQDRRDADPQRHGQDLGQRAVPAGCGRRRQWRGPVLWRVDPHPSGRDRHPLCHERRQDHRVPSPRRPGRGQVPHHSRNLLQWQRHAA